MLRTIAKIDWGKVPHGLFITLTYPDTHFNREYDVRTCDRSLFIRKLEEYADKNIPVLWRCEWQRRKTGAKKGLIVPHFHLLCMGIRFVPHQSVREWWRGILAVKGPLATDVRGITGKEGCGRYLAKYLSKSTSLDNGAYLNKPWMNGRHWGMTRVKDIPWFPIERNDEITAEEFRRAKEAFEAENAWASAGFGGSFTVLGEDRKRQFLEKWLQGLDGQPTGV